MKKKLLCLLILTLLLCGCEAEPVEANLWTETENGKMYLDAQGQPVTGWQTIGDIRYYFTETGILASGWVEEDGKRYCISDRGTPLTGWQTVDGARHYFYSDGSMALGRMILEGKEYYLTEDGAYTGVMEQNGTLALYDAEGCLYTGASCGIVEYEDSRYFLRKDGTLHTGWLELDGNTHYFHPEGAMAVGETVIDGIKYHFSPHGVRILLVNPWNYIPADYETELTSYKGIAYVASICYDPLVEMMEACRAAGHAPALVSAYRTQENQEWLYENRIRRWMNQGYNREEATVLAGKSVAIPGTSEHQLGLAVDIVDDKNRNLTDEQERTATQQWLMEHCWEYGFILRYPSDASQITGIIYEPWHYRYVGTEISMELQTLGITLEEYLGAAGQEQTDVQNAE